MAPDWTAYTDGGCKDELAGWGYVLTEGGDGVEDVQARVLDEGYGPVVVEEGHPAYIGATRPTNNTGELSAVAELMRALLEEQAMPPESNGVIRTDSEIAAAIMTGRAIAKENTQLAGTVRALWQRLRARHGKRVLWRHVKGHSGHKFNDRADELAEKGRLGDVCARGHAWAQAQPVEQPTLVRQEGCFAFAADRWLSLRLERGQWEVRVRTEVDATSLHWVSAGAMPHISLSSAPAGKEAREAVRTAIEQVQNEGGERTIGTPNRIALIFPPQITKGSDARRGVARAEERMDVASVVYQWGAGRDHARASWHISARLMPVEVVELGVAWCTRPARAAQVEVDEEPDSDPPAEQANANTCVNSEHEHGQQQAQPQEQADATVEQAQPALSTTGSRSPLPTFDTRWRQRSPVAKEAAHGRSAPPPAANAPEGAPRHLATTAALHDTEPSAGNTEAAASPLALAEQRYTRAVAEEEASHELTVDDGAGVFDDLGVRRSMADARAQSAQEVYLAEIAKAQCRLQPRTATAEEMTEVSNGEAAAGEAMVAPQQTEECSGATAMQLQPQQCANTPMQRQHIAIEAVQEIAAEAQTPLQEPSSALPAASFAMQISAAASSAAQKMHSIATHATSWWQRRRRNHTENANRMTETAANVDGQHAKELESTAAAAAARTEQPEASSATAVAADKKEARTHNSSCDAADHILHTHTRHKTPRAVTQHHGPLRNLPGRGSWSFGGRTWKPRASDHFAARPWGIEMMEVEAGAAIYRNKRAEGASYAHPPAPAGGRGLPHPLRGAGTGTDRPRAGPRQLAARAYGLMSSSIADWGQKGQREAQNSQD